MLLTPLDRVLQASLAMYSGCAAAGAPAGSAERATATAGRRGSRRNGRGAGDEQGEAGAVAAYEQRVQVRLARRERCVYRGPMRWP